MVAVRFCEGVECSADGCCARTVCVEFLIQAIRSFEACVHEWGDWLANHIRDNIDIVCASLDMLLRIKMNSVYIDYCCVTPLLLRYLHVLLNSGHAGRMLNSKHLLNLH